MNRIVKSKHHRDRNSETGFTLIELLIVILIIGVLATIAIPLFLNQRKTAVDVSMQADIHTMQLAFENCSIKATAYPDAYLNWSGKTTIPACLDNIKTSNGTIYHAFDYVSYYSSLATDAGLGQVYCIEMRNLNGGVSNTTTYFRSDKGNAQVLHCQDQGPITLP